LKQALKQESVRSGVDRRQLDTGPRGKLPERRRQPERRLPELTEIHDISFEGFQLLLAGTGKAAPKSPSPSTG